MKNGSTKKPLGELCEVFADGDWIEMKDQFPNGIRLVQTGNVGEGVFKNRSNKARYVSATTFKRLNCTEIFEGDCLISRLPDPVGRSCILPDTGERMITAVNCTIIRSDRKQLLPEFFNFYSQSLDYIAAVDHETTGTTRKRISRKKLGQTPIPAPPLPEQRRIVGILDVSSDEPRFVYYFFTGLDVSRLDSGAANPALNRDQVHPIKVDWPPVTQQPSIVATLDRLVEETQQLESIYQRKLAALDELKKSLLHQAFNGEL